MQKGYAVLERGSRKSGNDHYAFCDYSTKTTHTSFARYTAKPPKGVVGHCNVTTESETPESISETKWNLVDNAASNLGMDLFGAKRHVAGCNPVDGRVFWS